jgi:hypothetical protein
MIHVCLEEWVVGGGWGMTKLIFLQLYAVNQYPWTSCPVLETTSSSPCRSIFFTTVALYFSLVSLMFALYVSALQLLAMV